MTGIQAANAELAEIAATLRAHLEVEEELGGVGLPRSRIAAEAGAVASASAARNAPSPRREASVAGASVATHAAVDAATPALPFEPAPASEPATPLAPEEKRQRLALLAQESTTCTRCVLHERRNRVVFARGSAEAEIAFVGEGPGADEDQQGLPFVGRAGQLLDRMIAAMGYGREDVYVCNVVKCRPPENRTPRPEEAIACSRYLIPQLQTVAPKLIVALGRCAAENLGVAQATGSWRGRWGTWQGIAVMPTYHPAFLLRSPEHKRTVWEDLQKAMARLGRSPVRPQ